ncbi:MAG: DUF3047 domain-containing protein [Verrucomicrobiota bacterium]|nr:DUF3047 domain-containing protein [Verrucomicrobiota bacterium]
MKGLDFIRGVGGLIFALLISVQGAEFTEHFEGPLGKQWKPVKFEGLTEYRVMKEGTNSFLRAVSDGSASGLATEVKIKPSKDLKISWRWKLDKIPPGSSDDKIETFDHTVRLFVAFKTLVGPPRSINYVWGNSKRVGEMYHHPSSGRSRFIVLQAGNEKAGKWISEERNVWDDFKELFDGDEPPVIVGIGVMTDSDGTKSKVVGEYDAIVMERGASATTR